MNRRFAVLTLLVIFAGGVPAALLGSSPAIARTRLSTQTYAIRVACTSTDSGGFCLPPFALPVKTSKVFKIAFTADPAHCTPIQIAYEINFSGLIDGQTIDVVAPGESTGVVDLGPRQGPGTFWLAARDAPGGACADGPLGIWKGTLVVTTSKRVRR